MIEAIPQSDSIEPSATDGVVVIENLSRRFGDKKALDNVSLTIPRGSVYGLIGGNGAGKTTLLKHVTGMLAPQSGSVKVFGFDPTEEPVAVLSKIGFLSEERDLPNWMTIQELLRYTQAFYPTWDNVLANDLAAMFELDIKAKVRTQSRGQRARVGLLIAVAHRPELLVLDEPSSGLDPVVRRDVLNAIIKTVAHEGRTVLFSSHLLDEIDRVADRVAMLSNGRIVLEDWIDQLKSSFQRITLRYEFAPMRPPILPGLIDAELIGKEWVCTCRVSHDQEPYLFDQNAGFQIVEKVMLSLEEIFVMNAKSRISHPTPEHPRFGDRAS